MAKTIDAYVKLQIIPGAANPSPPIGPALGQKGVNIMEFCKGFNAQSQNLDKTMKVPVTVTVYNDRSFTFVIKTPPASALIKKALNLKSASKLPGTEKAGTLTREQLEEIAKVKMPDLTASDLEAAIRSIAGSARSMGIDSEGVQDAK